MDISNNICRSMLGTNDIRDGSMASKRYMSTSRSPRKPCRVNLPPQHSKLAMSFRRLVLPTARLCCPVATPRVNPRTGHYCPTTWNKSYVWQYAAEYADQLRNESCASGLLCKECTLLVRIQLSKKNANHPDCAFADSMSTVMCGAMISLTPCIAHGLATVNAISMGMQSSRMQMT